jgi:hypothetical protein
VTFDLSWLRAELDDAIGDYVNDPSIMVFGSAAMALHGLDREPGDIDLFVRPWAYPRLKSHGWEEQRPTPGDPPMLEWLGGLYPVHAFREWTARDDWIDMDRAWGTSEWVGEWRVMPLWYVRYIKIAAYYANPDSERHAKHLRDVAMIDEATRGLMRTDVHDLRVRG